MFDLPALKVAPQLIRLGWADTLNPNHRHDEAHEQEIDSIRTGIAKEHRFARAFGEGQALRD